MEPKALLLDGKMIGFYLHEGNTPEQVETIRLYLISSRAQKKREQVEREHPPGATRDTKLAEVDAFEADAIANAAFSSYDLNTTYPVS